MKYLISISLCAILFSNIGCVSLLFIPKNFQTSSEALSYLKEESKNEESLSYNNSYANAVMTVIKKGSIVEISALAEFSKSKNECLRFVVLNRLGGEIEMYQNFPTYPMSRMAIEIQSYQRASVFDDHAENIVASLYDTYYCICERYKDDPNLQIANAARDTALMLTNILRSRRF